MGIEYWFDPVPFRPLTLRPSPNKTSLPIFTRQMDKHHHSWDMSSNLAMDSCFGHKERWLGTKMEPLLGSQGEHLANG